MRAGEARKIKQNKNRIIAERRPAIDRRKEGGAEKRRKRWSGNGNPGGKTGEEKTAEEEEESGVGVGASKCGFAKCAARDVISRMSVEI